MNVKERKQVVVKFDEVATVYDQQRRKLIPCFDDFYNTALALAVTATDTPRILDLGAGTGLLSAFLLKKFPNASLTLIDLSEKMLEVARERLQSHPDIEYIVADYTQHEFEEPFDLVISSLSIHHLTDTEKKALYQYAFSLLKNGGRFINADQVLGSSPFLDSLYKQDWKQKVESSGLSREEILAAYERTKLDKMSPLDDQLNWLRDAGFADVDCVYKYYNFVVMTGRKLDWGIRVKTVANYVTNMLNKLQVVDRNEAKRLLKKSREVNE